MKIHLSFIFLVLLVFIFGCAPKSPLEIEGEYTQEQKQELAYLNYTYKLIRDMRAIDTALYLNKSDFNSMVKDSFVNFEQHFVSLNFPSFSKPTFGKMQLKLDTGSIRSKINFSFEVDALQRKIFGHLISKHTLKAAKDRFVLATNFEHIVLDKIDEAGSLAASEEDKVLIAKSVKSFLHTLNVEIINMPLEIEVDMNILEGINGKDIVKANDYKLHSASAVNMHTKMDSYVPYICKSGVALIGASELKDTQEASNEENLYKIKKVLITQLNRALNESMGIDLETLQKYSSYYVSKRYMAQQMSKALAKTDLRTIHKFFLKLPEQSKMIYKDITFFDKNQLPSCEGVKVVCSDLLQNCDRQCLRKYGGQRCQQCDKVNNPFEQVRCMSSLEACKSKEELHLYECNKREDRCSVHNEEIKTECEAKNLDRVALCQEDKDKLLFVNDEIVLAQLQLNLDIVNSYAVQRIRKIVFTPDLQSLEVNRDMHISVDTKMKLALINSKETDINCSLKMKEALLTHSIADYVNISREIEVLSQRVKGGNLMIKAISKPTFKSIDFEQKPYDNLLMDENFAVECRYKGMPMKPIVGEELLQSTDIPHALNIMRGELELQFDEEELNFLISTIRLQKNILFYPTMEKKALVFSRQAHFY